MSIVSGRPIGDDRPVTLDLEGGRIVGRRPGGDPEHVLAPGLVDVHCHGAGGHEFGVGDATEAAAFHHRAGSTSVVASLVSTDADTLAGRIAGLAPLVADRTLAGIHLEGPFLAPAQKGAHDPTALRHPDPDVAVTWTRLAGDGPCMVTLAPELAGGDATIDALLERGVVVALGHTDADGETIGSALARVASTGTIPVVTHLFNGMPDFHHRDAGPAMAALRAARRGDAWVELIADGHHLDDATIAGVVELAGDHVLLVSDATGATGLGDGLHRLGSLQVRVTGTTSRLVDGDSLAGSVTPLLGCVRRAVAAGVDVATAFAAATSHPAAALGLHDVGSLAVGDRADVLVLDDDLDLVRVWRDGRVLEPPSDPA
ncbi:N-acetylglucosamine-6-phosphate deacetylase [Salsipaludibacter albus]|uniref:N-acetylglucosamine-6-phosphate deacetylase n=1 Tax=Salsipaludibacter albus TaxID=2849650 RepID=UPI001EE3F8E1|nr:amidohydrolase family protein [Salsipaludibacter albus]MBY5160978.1 amidohydrolase family protein [Salsipaludibacter albus]